MRLEGVARGCMVMDGELTPKMGSLKKLDTISSADPPTHRLPGSLNTLNIFPTLVY